MPHKIAPRFILALTLSMAFLLASCGGSSGTPAAAATPGTTTPVLFVAASQSMTLNAAGGSVTLAGADGTQYQLVIPPGALTSSTTLTLTTQTPATGQQFNLLLQPAGLVLASGAVGTLTIQLPAGASLPATGGLVYDGVLVPFTRLADGQIQVSLPAFASSLPLTAQAPGESKPGNALKRIAAASSSVCGSAPTLQTNGGLAAVTAVDIELYGQCMVAAVQELAVNEQFVQAVRLAQSVAAYLQATGSGNASQFLNQASSLACLAYRQALDRAIGTSVSDMGTLYAQARPIMFWERTIQALGATCPGVPLTEYQTVIHTKAGEALVYYAQQKPGITATSGAAYARAKAEAIDSQKTRNEVLALNPPAALAATLNTEITQRAQPAVVDALLQAPWLRCRNTGNYDELMSLMDSLGSPEIVKSAAQYCGTRLTVEVFDKLNTSTQTLSGLGGLAAGQTQATGSLTAGVDGSIQLSGPISALGCPAGAVGSQELVVRFKGVEVGRLSTAPYLANALRLNISDLRAAASLANDNIDPQPLTIERLGTPCAGYWGPAPAPLITAMIALSGEPKIAFTPLSVTTISGPLFVVNPDGTGLRQIASDAIGDAITGRAWGRPTWSPDRQKIAYSNGYGIGIANADGSGPSGLAFGFGFPLATGDPAWAPDGKQIAYGTYSLNTGLYQICTDTFGVGSGGCIGGGGLAIERPSWSPNGARLAFIGATLLGVNKFGAAIGTADIYVTDAGGGGRTNLTNFPVDIFAFSVAWSPDGSELAYMAFDYSIGTYSIYVMNAVGGGGRGTLLRKGASFPAWSPDGRKLAFISDPGQILHVMNKDGSGVVSLGLEARGVGW